MGLVMVKEFRDAMIKSSTRIDKYIDGLNTKKEKDICSDIMEMMAEELSFFEGEYITPYLDDMK